MILELRGQLIEERTAGASADKRHVRCVKVNPEASMASLMTDDLLT